LLDASVHRPYHATQGCADGIHDLAALEVGAEERAGISIF